MSLLIPSQITPLLIITVPYSSSSEVRLKLNTLDSKFFKSNNNESYNDPFSVEELTDAMSKAHNTAIGPNQIHYHMIKHLPKEALQTLLGAPNDIWYSDDFPDTWRSLLSYLFQNLVKTNRTHPAILLFASAKLCRG